MAGESFEAHRTDDGGIVIHLGMDDAERYSVNASEGDGLDGDEKSSRRKIHSKQKFQCPKCDKVWNWPWELRRHVVSHYKEVGFDLVTIFILNAGYYVESNNSVQSPYKC